MQQTFSPDELDAQGVFKRPEEVGVSTEYMNPSFLVNKPNAGHRLGAAFAELGRYSKPQPSLLPDVDSTLRTIAQWKYIIATNLTSAFYQIPLSSCSMKYCGVASSFRGVRVYTHCAMGMHKVLLQSLLTIFTVVPTFHKLSLRTGDASYKLLKSATSTSLPQRSSSVLVPPPSLVENGQKEAFQPALIVLPRCLHALHSTCASLIYRCM